MSISSLLKRLTHALPAVLAAAPGVFDAVRQVKQSIKKPKKKTRAGAETRPADGVRP